MSKYGEYRGNQIEAVLNMIGGKSAIDRLLLGEVKCVLEVVNMILTINRVDPFDPATFIGEGWTIWRGLPKGKGLEGDEQQDARSLALTEVDFTKARFETCLEGKTKITGEDRLCRLDKLDKKDLIRADAKFGQTLYEEPGQKTLRWLYETYGVTWFELPGTILRGPRGYRHFLSLYRKDGGRWYWNFNWLDVDRHAESPALVFAISPPG